MANPNPKFENPEQFSDTIDDFPLSECISNQSDPSTSHSNSPNSETLRFRTDINEDSTITSVNDDDQISDSAESTHRVDFPNGSPSFLFHLANLVIKSIGFQLILFSGILSIPLSVFLIPFGVFTLSLLYSKKKFCELLDVVFSRKFSLAELALRFGFGFFYLVYVVVLLAGLFVVSVLFSAFVLRLLVAEPVQVRDALNFDYTENSPVAYVPIVSCAGVGGGGSCEEKSVPRVFPYDHKVEVTVSLTLPESKYNRNLGIFQVRVDFLSPCGRTLASSSHPSMLQYKSEPIRLVCALFQAVPLVSGYVSESQTLEVKFKGFTEGDVPTSCLRVTLQQRAEFRPGAGIPEVYDASLVIESELPLFRRIIWSWRKAIFVWVSMTSFMMELVFTLFCCRPNIIPGLRLRNDSTVVR